MTQDSEGHRNFSFTCDQTLYSCKSQEHLCMKTGNKDRLAGVQFLDTANQGMTHLISFIKIY